MLLPIALCTSATTCLLAGAVIALGSGRCANLVPRTSESDVDSFKNHLSDFYRTLRSISSRSWLLLFLTAIIGYMTYFLIDESPPSLPLLVIVLGCTFWCFSETENLSPQSGDENEIEPSQSHILDYFPSQQACTQFLVKCASDISSMSCDGYRAIIAEENRQVVSTTAVALFASATALWLGRKKNPPPDIFPQGGDDTSPGLQCQVVGITSHHIVDARYDQVIYTPYWVFSSIDPSINLSPQSGEEEKTDRVIPLFKNSTLIRSHSPQDGLSSTEYFISRAHLIDRYDLIRTHDNFSFNQLFWLSEFLPREITQVVQYDQAFLHPFNIFIYTEEYENLLAVFSRDKHMRRLAPMVARRLLPVGAVLPTATIAALLDLVAHWVFFLGYRAHNFRFSFDYFLMDGMSYNEFMRGCVSYATACFGNTGFVAPIGDSRSKVDKLFV